MTEEVEEMTREKQQDAGIMIQSNKYRHLLDENKK